MLQQYYNAIEDYILIFYILCTLLHIVHTVHIVHIVHTCTLLHIAYYSLQICIYL